MRRDCLSSNELFDESLDSFVRTIAEWRYSTFSSRREARNVHISFAILRFHRRALTCRCDEVLRKRDVDRNHACSHRWKDQSPNEQTVQNILPTQPSILLNVCNVELENRPWDTDECISMVNLTWRNAPPSLARIHRRVEPRSPILLDYLMNEQWCLPVHMYREYILGRNRVSIESLDCNWIDPCRWEQLHWSTRSAWFHRLSLIEEVYSGSSNHAYRHRSENTVHCSPLEDREERWNEPNGSSLHSLPKLSKELCLCTGSNCSCRRGRTSIRASLRCMTSGKSI